MVPLLVVLTHRPEFQSRWSGQGHVGALNLSKLTRAQSAAMVSALAGGKSRPCVAVSTFGAASRPDRRVPGSWSPGWSGFWAADLGHPGAHLRPFAIIAPNMITPALD
jgi:hypothetical protein